MDEIVRDPQVDVQLRNVVDGLVNHTGGAIPRENLAAIVDDLYAKLARDAKLTTYLPVIVGRAALQRVRAEQADASRTLLTKPEVLIVCQDNIGRSQAAAALLRYYAPGMLYIVSAGVAPKGHVLTEVTEGLASRGVHLTDPPQAFAPSMLDDADHLIIVGDTTADALPEREGVERIEWRAISHLEGLPPTDVAEVLVQIDLRVREVLATWFPDLDLGEPVMQQTPA
ncbi:MAG: hypothetical protein IPG68_03045 [Micrococcales bacterium]|nr:hypothetical protein [Micrococcales bacterium]